MSQVTALQSYALPGRKGGPYTKPTPPLHIRKMFVSTATRKATFALDAGRDLLFVLTCDRQNRFTLEV